MHISRAHRRATTAVLPLLLLTVAPAAAQAAAPADLPQTLAAPTATTTLDGLSVAKLQPLAGFNRDRFPRWANQNQHCDTRETIIKRDGKNVITDEHCRAVSGSWLNPYDGITITDPSQLEIDYVVPLANAWRSGANTWTDAQRRKFANDLDAPLMLAVSKDTRRAKENKTPDQWRPPARDYWCTYSRAWVDVKSRYHLSVTQDEKKVLHEMLETCSAEQSES